MKWISVNKDLPQLDEKVCIVLKNGYVTVACRTIPWPVTKKVYWHTDILGYIDEKQDIVLYWLPLPVLPDF